VASFNVIMGTNNSLEAGSNVRKPAPPPSAAPDKDRITEVGKDFAGKRMIK
jgi:hypothetical protein